MKRSILSAIVVAFALPACPLSSDGAPPNPQDPIPVDPQTKIGELDNGLRYYLRVNGEPGNRAQLWLAVNAGSILEDDDQQGLAHFVEHMAFNGTEHFSENQLIHYMESIGMRFGPELNAFTNFDETVYMLEVPTDTTEIVETAVQILEDWAHGLTFDEEEIDKERGVIGEEWRLGRGAQMRMLDKQLPILFKGSRYAERIPIGKKAVIDTCSYDTLRRFYRDWYRPDLMAVVAVGDFDPEWIEGLIERHFALLPMPADPREREIYPVPDHEETLFAVATDPEATHTTTAVLFKSDAEPELLIEDYRTHLIKHLHDDMLNDRLMELTKEAEPPFLFAMTADVPLARSKKMQMFASLVNEGGIEKGLEALLTESARASRHGFTASELERSKEEMLRQAENAYAERDKTKSKILASRCLAHFTKGEPMPGIESEYALAKQLVPGIALEELNELSARRVAEDNRVVLVSAPEKEGLAVPAEEDLAAVFEKVSRSRITPYEDMASDEPLLEEIPEPAEVESRSRIDELGVTEWTLSNGVEVVLKPTDFKNDEVRFWAYSPGGHSLVSDPMFVSASLASHIVQESGVGEFNSVALEKKLSGKVVEVSPYIGEITEGLSGTASPQDLETMFQLIYLYMTSPRNDADAFDSFYAKMKGTIENRSASPEAAFFDTLQVTVAQHHHRMRPWTVQLLDEINLDDAYDFYRDRFADADDFVFIFVGNFELEAIEPMVKTYLGGLPTTDREETWKDPGIALAEGVIERTVRKGIEERGRVAIVFAGPMKWSLESKYELDSLAEVMEIDLREVLREELGGTYGVGINSYAELYPRQEYQVHVTFGCDPNRIEELTQTVLEKIENLRDNGPDPEHVERVRESQKRQFEVNLKDNGFWLAQLHTRHLHGTDPALLLEYPRLVEDLSAQEMKQAAVKYLKPDDYVRVVLVPEER